MTRRIIGAALTRTGRFIGWVDSKGNVRRQNISHQTVRHVRTSYQIGFADGFKMRSYPKVATIDRLSQEYGRGSGYVDKDIAAQEYRQGLIEGATKAKQERDEINERFRLAFEEKARREGRISNPRGRRRPPPDEEQLAHEALMDRWAELKMSISAKAEAFEPVPEAEWREFLAVEKRLGYEPR